MLSTKRKKSIFVPMNLTVKRSYETSINDVTVLSIW